MEWNGMVPKAGQHQFGQLPHTVARHTRGLRVEVGKGGGGTVVNVSKRHQQHHH